MIVLDRTGFNSLATEADTTSADERDLGKRIVFYLDNTPTTQATLIVVYDVVFDKKLDGTDRVTRSFEVLSDVDDGTTKIPILDKGEDFEVGLIVPRSFFIRNNNASGSGTIRAHVDLRSTDPNPDTTAPARADYPIIDVRLRSGDYLVWRDGEIKVFNNAGSLKNTSAGQFVVLEPLNAMAGGGEPLKIAATSTPGTTVHTAVTGTEEVDLVTLQAVNTHTAPVTITVEWGSTSNVWSVEIPQDREPFDVVMARPMNNAEVIAVFASVTNVVFIMGGYSRFEAL